MADPWETLRERLGGIPLSTTCPVCREPVSPCEPWAAVLMKGPMRPELPPIAVAVVHELCALLEISAPRQAEPPL